MFVLPRFDPKGKDRQSEDGATHNEDLKKSCVDHGFLLAFEGCDHYNQNTQAEQAAHGKPVAVAQEQNGDDRVSEHERTRGARCRLDRSGIDTKFHENLQ
jgi:hypothetical protein